MQEENFIEDDHYPEGVSKFTEHLYVPKSIEIVRAKRFIPETIDILKRYHWIKRVEYTEGGSPVGIIECHDIYGHSIREVHLGEWIVLTSCVSNAIILSDSDFREHYELRNFEKHNCDTEGKYPTFTKGDFVKFHAEEFKDRSFSVVKQILHMDGSEEFWGNVILEDIETKEIIRTHGWMIYHE